MTTTLRIVALEEHLLTEEVRAAWAALPAADRDDSVDFYYHGPILDRLLDLTDERIRRMDETGIDVQVLSLTTPGLQVLDSAASPELARATNQLIASTVEAAPGRFQGFATLPTAAPDQAATELRHAVSELGMKGAMLYGRTRDRNLDHPANDPIFAAAHELRVPLYLHAQTPPRPVREAYYSGLPGDLDIIAATVGVGWHYDAGLQFLRLILSGVLDRYPDLQIVLGHWGDLLGFYFEELDKIPRLAKSDMRPVSEYFRQHAYLTPSGVLSHRYLSWAREAMGIDRLMFSMDYPFSPATGSHVDALLHDTGLDETEKHLLTSGNWDALVRRIRA
jgi:predicted TIM-barrel fold metal-dependent hydrolase